MRAPGSVRRKGNAWQVVVETAPDPLTGKRRRAYRTAKTEKAAHRLRAQMIAEGQQAHDSRTVVELMDAWLTHICPDLSPSTLIGYRGKIDGYIIPLIGTRKLEQVTPAVLDEVYARLREKGGADGKPLSARTVRHVHAILRAGFAQALRWDWVARNPVLASTAPRAPSGAPESPSAVQVRRLVTEATRNDPGLGLQVRLAALSGLRRGELCALRWGDLASGSLTVAGSVVVDRGKLVVKGTKTGRVRVVPLDPATVKLLAAHRKGRQAEYRKLKVTLTDRCFIFSESEDGLSPPHPDTFTKRYSRLAAKLGIQTTLHGLRHFHLSALLGAGVPVHEAAARAGHASARTTLDVYAHVLTDRGAEHAARVAALLD